MSPKGGISGVAAVEREAKIRPYSHVTLCVGRQTLLHRKLLNGKIQRLRNHLPCEWPCLSESSKSEKSNQQVRYPVLHSNINISDIYNRLNNDNQLTLDLRCTSTHWILVKWWSQAHTEKMNNWKKHFWRFGSHRLYIRSKCYFLPDHIWIVNLSSMGTARNLVE